MKNAACLDNWLGKKDSIVWPASTLLEFSTVTTTVLIIRKYQLYWKESQIQQLKNSCALSNNVLPTEGTFSINVADMLLIMVSEKLISVKHNAVKYHLNHFALWKKLQKMHYSDFLISSIAVWYINVHSLSVWVEERKEMQLNSLERNKIHS